MTTFISARYLELDETRLVLVAELEDPAAIGLRFRGTDGEVTTLRLTKSAAAALGELLTNPLAGTQTDDKAFPPDNRSWVYRWSATVAATPAQSSKGE